jgi:hypothetical protein
MENEKPWWNEFVSLDDPFVVPNENIPAIIAEAIRRDREELREKIEALPTAVCAICIDMGCFSACVGKDAVRALLDSSNK